MAPGGNRNPEFWTTSRKSKRQKDVDNPNSLVRDDKVVLPDKPVIFAANHGLNNLIVLYDSNNVTLDGNKKITFSENVSELAISVRRGFYLVLLYFSTHS